MVTPTAPEIRGVADSGFARHLDSWRPEPVVEHDDLPVAPVVALSAVLDVPAPAAETGDELPPLWHWLYFLNWPPQHALGADGHPLHGPFLPPLPDRRRMFAGGRLDVREPLLIGTPARRESSLHRVEVKRGSTGEMVFVTTRHQISQGGRVCQVEEQDIVYRSGEDAPGRGRWVVTDDPPPPGDAVWPVSMRPDSRALFRISALTANTHRIHYDCPYVRDVEGYPGLVVHGPLLALLMLESVRRHGGDRVRSLSYRLRKPVFAGEKIRARVEGEPPPAGSPVRIRVETARDSAHATAAVTRQ
jgi:3-methylfumaryl-CoA hydratase